MYIRYRNIACQPSLARSSNASVAWHRDDLDESGYFCQEFVGIDGLSRTPNGCVPHANLLWPTPFTAVSTLEFCKRCAGDEPYVTGMLYVLQFMPNLYDLTIDFDFVVPATRPAELPPFPFRLRRLVLEPTFPGCATLIRGSRDTLQCLALGNRLDASLTFSELLEDVDLSTFGLLRALRRDGDPDPWIVSSCKRLQALTLWGDGHLPFIQHCIRQPLRHLSLVYCNFNAADSALALAGAISTFPALGALRSIEIETDAGDNFTLTGHPGKEALADVCTARRISVSVLRTRFGIRHWGTLDAASRHLL
ncbi:hypothetical protein AURDEDRAFT_176085 [Auricularia subglabra TFB-10046 SS5]|nr:hypothetical protein AURDEDRAFT_176085 [Auricularia subglabra TFB-10046 SS5]